MSLVLQPPIKVSPIIKLARYTCLIAGIFYGNRKLAFYRAHDRPLKVKRDLENELYWAEMKNASFENFMSFCTEYLGMLGFHSKWREIFK